MQQKIEDAGNLYEKFWPYECVTFDKQVLYLYSCEGCQICTSVVNEKINLTEISSFLLGKEEKALSVVNKICDVNGKPPFDCHLIVKNETCGEYMVVFQQPHTR